MIDDVRQSYFRDETIETLFPATLPRAETFGPHIWFIGGADGGKDPLRGAS